MYNMITTILSWAGAAVIAYFFILFILFIFMIIGQMLDVLIHPPRSSEQSDLK